METKIKFHQIIVIIILSLFLIQVIATLPFKSPSYDEPGHLSKSIIFLKTGEILIVGHPPLMHIITAIPLIFINVQIPANYKEYLNTNDPTFFGQKILYGTNNDAKRIFFWSRLPLILLGTLLGYYVYKWAMELYGINAGIFALLIYAFNPVIIGNTPLLMTDMIVACFSFISFYCLWKFLSDRTGINLIFAGITFGFAQASKFSALFLIPLYIFFIVFSAYDLSFKTLLRDAVKKERLKRLASLGLSFGAIIFMALLIINITYAFDGFLKPLSERIKDDTYSYYDKPYFMPDAIAGRVTINPLLKSVLSSALNYGSAILPYGYIKEVVAVVRINNPEITGSATGGYFRGEYSREGFWYYNPIAFLIKSPIPFLLLIMTSIVISVYSKIDFKSEAFIILPVLMLFVFFLASVSNGSLRYILPVFPFIIVFTGRIFSKKLRLVWIPVVLLLIWYLVESVFIFPNYAAYFNQIIGGPSNGYKYLHGSDLDAGQDLPLLADYVNKNGIRNLKLAYYGTPNPYTYLNFTCMACSQCPQWILEKCPENCMPTKGTIAVSASFLQNTPHLNNRTCFDWIESYEPIEKIGYTIFVYNITNNTS